MRKIVVPIRVGTIMEDLLKTNNLYPISYPICEYYINTIPLIIKYGEVTIWQKKTHNEDDVASV